MCVYIDLKGWRLSWYIHMIEYRQLQIFEQPAPAFRVIMHGDGVPAG